LPHGIPLLTDELLVACRALEAFSGVMYIALVVSRLVALTVVAKKERM